MYALFRVACVSVALTLAAGPLGAAAAESAQLAQATAAPAAATTAIVSGIVSDGSGAPVAGATVSTSEGPTITSTITSPTGVYSLTLAQGIYTLNASKAGFTGASTVDYAVVGGSNAILNVTLVGATLTSLQQIGHVRVSSGRSGFNTSAASVETISNQAFVDQGAQQVQHVLEQTPGIVIDHPGTSANNAAPGAITI